MTDEEYDAAVALWNAGKDTRAIAEALGLNIYDLHPIMRAAMRVVMNMTADGPVMLERRGNRFQPPVSM